MFSSSLRDYTSIKEVEVEELDCANPSKWKQGRAILRVLDQVNLLTFEPFQCIHDSKLSTFQFDNAFYRKLKKE